MNNAPTTYTDLDKANVADDHYHQRRNATKPPALRHAERALERANDDLALMTKLYDRGLATADDFIEALETRAIVFNLRSLLLDFWWIEMNAKAAELEAFRRGELGYSYEAGVFQSHKIEEVSNGLSNV